MSRVTVQIDGAGRLVLPKAIRKHFNLGAGDQLRVSVNNEGIHLEPTQPAGQLVRAGSVLVFRGQFDEPITTELVERMLEEDRQSAADVQYKSRKR